MKTIAALSVLLLLSPNCVVHANSVEVVERCNMEARAAELEGMELESFINLCIESYSAAESSQQSEGQYDGSQEYTPPVEDQYNSEQYSSDTYDQGASESYDQYVPSDEYQSNSYEEINAESNDQYNSSESYPTQDYYQDNSSEVVYE